MRRAAATLIAAAVLSGCTIPTEDPPTPPPPATSAAAPAPPLLDAAVAAVSAEIPGRVGLATSDGTDVIAAGDDSASPAWSTIKVPLAIAALRADPALAGTASAAIRVSDNAAAEVLWESATADSVDAVLAEGQAGTVVNRQVLRPEFSIFGQTPWAPGDQARFAAHLPCLSGAEPVLADMGMVDPGQSWGLGTVEGARFKGGWGPDPEGRYTARQFGLLPSAEGDVAVALTVSPESGTFEDAQAMATRVVEKLGDLDGLPTATCG